MSGNLPTSDKTTADETFTAWSQTNDPEPVIEAMRKGAQLSKAQLSRVMHPSKGSLEIFDAHIEFAAKLSDEIINYCIDTYSYNCLIMMSSRGVLEKHHLQQCIERDLLEVVVAELDNRQVQVELVDYLIQKKQFDALKKAALDHQSFSDKQILRLIQEGQFELVGLLVLDGVGLKPEHKESLAKAGFGTSASVNKPPAPTISRATGLGSLSLVAGKTR